MFFVYFSSGGDLLILSTLTAIYKVVDTLAAFMSPYLEKLLYEISTLSAKNEMLVQAEPQLKAPHKLKLIRYLENDNVYYFLKTPKGCHNI